MHPPFLSLLLADARGLSAAPRLLPVIPVAHARRFIVHPLSAFCFFLSYDVVVAPPPPRRSPWRRMWHSSLTRQCWEARRRKSCIDRIKLPSMYAIETARICLIVSYDEFTWSIGIVLFKDTFKHIKLDYAFSSISCKVSMLWLVIMVSRHNTAKMLYIRSLVWIARYLIGKTRRLKINEHRNHIKRSATQHLVITDHRLNHEFDRWNLDEEPILYKKLLSEMIYQTTTKNSLNLQTDTTTDCLNGTYEPIINKSKSI